MKKTLILITFSLGLFGCGGGSSSGNSAPVAPGLTPGKGDTPMVINELYSVSSGDQVIKNSPLAKLKVTHVDGSRGSSVELIEGSAILRVN